jgi:site-specific recombinase
MIFKVGVGAVMTNKREALLEEINLLNERIRQLRRMGKNCSAETQELIRLILELDNLEQDKEIEEYNEDGS